MSFLVTVTTVWNTGETGDIYSMYDKKLTNLFSCFYTELIHCKHFFVLSQKGCILRVECIHKFYTLSGATSQPS